MAARPRTAAAAVVLLVGALGGGDRAAFSSSSVVVAGLPAASAADNSRLRGGGRGLGGVPRSRRLAEANSEAAADPGDLPPHDESFFPHRPLQGGEDAAPEGQLRSGEKGGVRVGGKEAEEGSAAGGAPGMGLSPEEAAQAAQAPADLAQPPADEGQDGAADAVAQADSDEEEEDAENPFSKFIVGGSAASQESYPWFCTPRGCHRNRNGSWDCCGYEDTADCWLGCGAVLIASDYVLTAAHCIDEEERHFKITSIEVGTFCHDRDNCGRRREVVAVDRCEVHPEYGPVELGGSKGGTGSMPQFDVALCPLSHPVTGIPPVDVDVRGVAARLREGLDEVTAVGLGRQVERNRGSSGDFPEQLLEVTLDHMSDERCRGAYKDNFRGRSMMCANDRGQSTCGGDSGSPVLAYADSYCQGDDGGEAEEVEGPVLVGMTSWGTTICDGAHPSVFAEVEAAAEWYGPIVCNDASEQPCWCRVCLDPDAPRWCNAVTVADGEGTGATPTEAGATSTVAAAATEAADSSTEATSAAEAADSETGAGDRTSGGEDESEAGGGEASFEVIEEEEEAEAEDEENDDGGEPCEDTSYHKYCRNRKNDYHHCTCGELASQDESERSRICKRKNMAKLVCKDTCAGRCRPDA